MNSKLLLFFQFFFIATLILFNLNSLFHPLAYILYFLSFIVGFLSLQANHIGNFNITPEIKDNAKLITTGVYKYIRHPMYSCVMLFMLGVISGNINTLNLFILILLVCTLFLKAKKEESYWQAQSKEYQKYMTKSKMFIPFIL